MLAPTLISIGDRTESVVQALGGRVNLARTLKVSTSQPTRWLQGAESPNPQNARAIVDLDHVIARARLLWADDKIVKEWLNSSNAHLDGARPIDVVVSEGPSAVVEALDQEMSGAYA